MRSVVQGYVSLRGGDALQILEVGAGTGATTAALLPILPPQSHYEFTDVSDLFLGRAATKFAAYPFVRYARLDIEQAPAAQGYAGRTFDVIVAVNVLHAAADLHAALDHLYTLLAPGGVLLLGEATEPLAWFDITTALIEGWQRFDDDLRRDQPLLPAQAWERALRAHNFVEVAAWPQPLTPAEVLGQHVIAALKGGDAGESDACVGDAYAPMGAGRAAGQDNPSRGAASEPIADTVADAAAVRARLLAAVPDERRALVFELVCSRIRSVLRLEDDAPLDETQRLLDMGLDSLMALELRRLLAYALDLGEERVSATLVFDYPTIGAIVGYLEGLVLAAQPAAAAAPVPAQGEPADRGHQKNGHADRLAEVAAMSDADVEALLLAKLNRR